MVLPYYGNGALFMMFLHQGGLCNLLLPYLFIFFFTVVKVGFVISYYLFIFFFTVAQS